MLVPPFWGHVCYCHTVWFDCSSSSLSATLLAFASCLIDVGLYFTLVQGENERLLINGVLPELAAPQNSVVFVTQAERMLKQNFVGLQTRYCGISKDFEALLKLTSVSEIITYTI